MLNNQLKFNDIMYTVTTLNNVPGAVNQVSLSARSSNDIFVIGGSTTIHCVYRNFYESNFVYYL